MVKIRLKRVGATKRPSYRIVAAEAWGPRDGRFLETLGHYNPLSNPATVVINEDKLNAWLQNGAEPTETVVRILLRTGVALPDRVKSIVKVHGTKKQALQAQATAATAAAAATTAAAAAATTAAAAAAATTAAAAAAATAAAASAPAAAPAPAAEVATPEAEPTAEAEVEAPAEEAVAEAVVEAAAEEPVAEEAAADEEAPAAN